MNIYSFNDSVFSGLFSSGLYGGSHTLGCTNQETL